MSRPACGHESALIYAGFWIRVWAAIVDSILVMCVLWPLLLVIPGAVSTHEIRVPLETTVVTLTAFESRLPWPAQFLLTWVLPAVAVVLFWIYRSATPGKMLIAAKIVDADTGGQPGKARLIGRYLGYYVSVLPLCLGLIWVGVDRRKQGWHDKLAGTVVVRRKKYATPSFADNHAGNA